MATKISALKMYTQAGAIHVRAIRVWIATNTGQQSSFNCVFADNEGKSIQASAKANDIAYFSNQIEEGSFYEVKNFYTYENDYINSIVDNQAFIDLSRNTVIQPLQTPILGIPRYMFSLVDFTNLPTKGKESRTLTDVLGRLKAVQALQNITVRGSRIEAKKEIFIENIRNEELRVTLWGDIAKRFDEEILQTLQQPIIIVFSGFRVAEFLGKSVLNSTAASLWYFSPDIPELLSYVQWFKFIPTETEILPVPYGSAATLAEQKVENRKTIHELLCTNPTTCKGKRFTCCASITDYDTTVGWWYNKCPMCTKGLRPEGKLFRCETHGCIDKTPVPWLRASCLVTNGIDVANFTIMGKSAENFFGNSAHHYIYERGFKDPYIIPPPLAEKLMKPYIFQVYFGNFKIANSRCDIIISNVFDDPGEEQEENQPHQQTTADIISAKSIPDGASGSSPVDIPINPLTPSIKNTALPSVSPLTQITPSIKKESDPPTFATTAKRTLLFPQSSNTQLAPSDETITVADTASSPSEITHDPKTLSKTSDALAAQKRQKTLVASKKGPKQP